MPNENYILLERTELNAAAASVTFASIPQTGYTDLKIVMSLRSTQATAYNYINMTINSLTTSIYTHLRLLGFDGTNVYTEKVGPTGPVNQFALAGANGTTSTANTFSNVEIYIPNYTSSTAKSMSIDYVVENNSSTSNDLGIQAELFNSTGSISQLSFAPSSASFAANSTFSLYGIAALGTTPTIAPKASGGNRIDNDGTYWYHTFTSSGSFVPQTGLTCDVLVVAGGGGGGELGGGGGAGGLAAYTSQALTNGTNYSCTIGAGGVGTNNTGGTSGFSGNNSTFQGLTAAVGGGGGGRYDSSGLTGGSGGGAGRQFVTAATGTSGQGNNGGVGIASYASSAAGGGGAGAVGANATNPNGGAGGIGSNTYSSWASATSTGVSGYYAGGGGGGSIGATAGAGGTGGGGTGSIASGSFGSNGTVNTGGGAGGGSGGGSTGGTGGSGIIIVRYTIA
jgi:hypothetical protein